MIFNVTQGKLGVEEFFAAALAASMGEAGFPLQWCALALRECKDATDDLLYGHAMDWLLANLDNLRMQDSTKEQKKDTKLELGSQQETKQKADYEDVMAEVLYLINMDIDPEEKNVLGNMYNSVWHLLGFVDIEQILVSF